MSLPGKEDYALDTPGFGLWLALAALLALAVVPAAGTTLYVSTKGNDAWSGKLARPRRDHRDGPFATLERARDELRRLRAAGALSGGAAVLIRGGSYQLGQAFALAAQDSGTRQGRITYQAYPGEQVRLVGGKLVTGFRPVTDPQVLARLEPAARGKVLQADLRALGVTDYGEVKGGGLELFFRNRRMTLARWPNQGFTTIVDTAGGDRYDIRGTWGDRIGKFVYEGDRPSRWIGEQDPWVHGYWFWDWSDERHPVAAIDPAQHTISVRPPYHGYGYRKGQWYYAFNLLSELDAPGEWYLDRAAGVLYFRPPSALAAGRPTVSVLSTLVTMSDVSYLTLQGLLFEAARGTAVTISGGTGNRVSDCTLRNLGGYGVTVHGGRGHGVSGCEIYQTGQGGISLEGGDRRTLAAARHFAENNHIHHYSEWNRMYHPAIAISGVGIRVAHNLIHDAPHEAVGFWGNDHVMEYNEIHHVCTESNDAGAIYCGRDWTMRGNVVRYNFMHHVTGFRDRGCVGVYLDDMLCGTTIFGNVFYQVTEAAFVGGGRDTVIENNIFVDCRPAVHVDARALGWAADTVPTTMIERLQAMPYQQPPWSTRYPLLVGITQDEPAAPKGNLVLRNICVGGRWDEIEEKIRPLVTFRDNLLDQDPHFVDPARLNFQLRADSPAYRLGFKRIPVEKIGPQPPARR